MPALGGGHVRREVKEGGGRPVDVGGKSIQEEGTARGKPGMFWNSEAHVAGVG